jgi:tRNA-dihydrouridine synthase
MEGVSRPEFVRAVNHLKLVKRWMTPFLRVSDSCFKAKKVREFLAPYLESGLPVTAQIMGTNSAVLAELAQPCLDCGASDINLNCGCPSKRVYSGGAGGGALKDPDQLCSTVRTIRKAIGDTARFSVKMRTGFSEPAEMLSLIPRLTDEGVDKFFIHYRTVREQYLPSPGRTERLQQAVAAAKDIPVIVNGDISTVADGRTLAEETGACGVMIARAFMTDPWLPARFENEKTPAPEDGRKIFFKTLVSFGVSGGNRLELSRMIFGANSDEFKELLRSEFISK